MSRATITLALFATVFLPAMTPVSWAQHADVTIRVETHPSGLSTEYNVSLRIVADQFETGAAQIRYSGRYGLQELPSDADSFQLSAETTASILRLVQELQDVPEHESIRFQEGPNGEMIISTDGVSQDIWIGSGRADKHYFRGDLVEDLAGNIGALLQRNVNEQNPPDIASSVTALREVETPRSN